MSNTVLFGNLYHSRNQGRLKEIDETEVFDYSAGMLLY